MSTPNPAEEIAKLEQELQLLKSNKSQAIEVANNCEIKIIQIEQAILTHKQYLPVQETKTSPAGFSNN